MIKNILEKLNTPVAVVAVLAVILLANGVLFYQSRSPEPEISDVRNVRESSPDRNADEPAAPEATEEATTGEENTNPEAEPATEREETSEEPPPEEQPREEAPDKEASDEEAPDEEAPEEQPEASEGGGDRALLAGLSESVGSCGGTSEEDERCIRDFVGEVSPESRYVGGRIDLAARAEDTNTEFIYFEDPDLAPCEFERAEYDGEANRYAVILIGEGSFSDARGEECIPQA
ncbi:hypothetical protein [Rubrobacter indicoceani]|uniref:hypothetical protein n=1 Tax=Rubrobacter indicoceani TaxID=2051957 RepID=UPI000E5A1305|nr:hypothetical protein [Rubrobacter indicoceani]